MHVHTSPDIIERKLSDVELAERAKSANMAGILIKNHFESTVSRAIIAQKVVGGIKVYGGIVLNRSVGGLNPNAVEVALNLGGKEVWMPTVDALNHRQKTGSPLEGAISILKDDGSLKEEVYHILDLIAQKNVILGTGHLSLKEIAVLIEEAFRRGVQKVLVTHPELWITKMPIDLQLELSKRGVFFERCFYAILSEDPLRHVSIEEAVSAIKMVGVRTTVIASDLGQAFNPDPVEGFKSYVSILNKTGIIDKEIEIMACSNPKELLE
ncbi:MAG: hypothetical protein PWQ16_458 [bacterium]|nr:hypothetical protein [bacterium]